MRRKIKLSTLEALSGVISHDEMVHYSSGGDGTRNHPFAFNEYKICGYAFTQGWVVLPDGTLAYLTQNYFSYSGHTEIYYIGTTDYRLFSNTDYYYGSSPSSNTLEQALAGAGIGVGCTAIGVTAPIGLGCGEISVTLSVVALVVDE